MKMYVDWSMIHLRNLTEKLTGKCGCCTDTTTTTQKNTLCTEAILSPFNDNRRIKYVVYNIRMLK